MLVGVDNQAVDTDRVAIGRRAVLSAGERKIRRRWRSRSMIARRGVLDVLYAEDPCGKVDVDLLRHMAMARYSCYD
jgi:hypothetical protein